MSPRIFFTLSLRPPEWDKTEWTSLKNLAKNVFLNIKNMERIGTAEKLILIFMRKTKLTIKWIDQTIENVLKVIFRQKYHLTDTERSEKVRYRTEVDRSVHFRFAQLFSANFKI